MRYIHLNNVTFDSTNFKRLTVFLDDQERVIVLPLLWLIHISSTQSVFTFNNGFYRHPTCTRNNLDADKSIKESNVSEKSIRDYVQYVYHFLCYLNKESKLTTIASIHNTELLNSKTINHYLNQVLPRSLKGNSLKCHQSAITAYTNFLSSLKVKEPLKTRIYPKTRQFIAEHLTHKNKISYVSRSERHSMLKNCTNDRDRLLLRMGYEVGLRAEENLGLIMSSHNAKGESHDGLLNLFSELESQPNKYSFSFTLNGKFTKGGKTRQIYFDRELLLAMRDYFIGERKKAIENGGHDNNHLFVRYDNGGEGMPISASQATSTFREVKNRVPSMNKGLSYHDLRHTFATELYHQELNSAEGYETRSESAALLVVQERLGHSSSKSKKLYIRLRMLMLSIEGERNDFQQR
mgnify:CR=1 FL=1